jgi:hypothetical protein
VPASKPSLLAWITCDGVHIDPASGKHTILGVFSNIKARSFPVMHPYMVWFLTITDAQPGKHKIKMSMGLDPTNPTDCCTANSSPSPPSTASTSSTSSATSASTSPATTPSSSRWTTNPSSPRA